MTTTPITSSFIAAVRYDGETRTLTVEMKSGGSYTHEGVPPEVFDAFMASPSKGRFYNAEIKGSY